MDSVQNSSTAGPGNVFILQKEINYLLRSFPVLKFRVTSPVSLELNFMYGEKSLFRKWPPTFIMLLLAII